MNLRLTCALLVLTGLVAPLMAGAGDFPGGRWLLEAEGGVFWQTRNDVQIPNDPTGTRFALDGVTGQGPWPTGRLYLSYALSPRSSLRLLFAPLEITETGSLPGPVNFAGTAFHAADPAEATYKFNSYRLSYRYLWHEGARWRWWIGITAKVRDAKVQLIQGPTTATDTDVGFVPLLHLAAAYELGRGWRLLLDVDALAGGPGRAEDASLKLGRDLGDRLTFAAGYRTLEGGADVEAVYTFAWLHYAVGSLSWRF